LQNNQTKTKIWTKWNC